MDVVYFIKVDPENDSEELRYSLRSLRNIPHGKVFIVGEKPDWVTNVEHIFVPQTGSKNENVSTSLHRAAESNLISNDFIFMNDDFFLMKDMAEIPVLNFGRMQRVIEAYENRYKGTTPYIENMKSLFRVLQSKGIHQPVSYELHVPMVINRQRTLELYGHVSGERMYQFRSYYGNHFSIGGKTINDVKVFVDPVHNDADYNHSPKGYLQSQVFLSSTGGAFKRGLVGDYIRSSFVGKSIYEKD